MRRIGVFGGTFDPVHIGHLVAASWCKEALDMELMLMVVANEPWQKVGIRVLTGAEERFSVVEAAVEGIPGVEASRIEIDRGGPSYTADTVGELRKTFPGAEICVVVGLDVAADLGTWRRADEINGEATLVVVDRGGAAAEADPLGQWGWKGPVQHVQMPVLDVSSSELRDRLEQGRTVDFLIPAPAIRRIRDLGLYSVG